VDWGTERTGWTHDMEKRFLGHIEEELNVSHMTILRILHE
jgi:hypothetical protein